MTKRAIVQKENNIVRKCFREVIDETPRYYSDLSKRYRRRCFKVNGDRFQTNKYEVLNEIIRMIKNNGFDGWVIYEGIPPQTELVDGQYRFKPTMIGVAKYEYEQ